MDVMESRIVQYGLFWEPPQTICDFINFWKEEVRKVEPEAKYLNHRVHSTFFLLMAFKKDRLEIIKSVENNLKEKNSFIVNFSGFQIFKNDLLTGGDILTLAIQTSPEIFNIQNNIASAMIEFKKTLVPYNINWKGDFAESYNIWGFPFVGEHWLPHVSIASVNKKGQNIIQIAQTMNQFPKSVLLNQFGLYEIMGNNQKHLHSFQLE